MAVLSLVVLICLVLWLVGGFMAFMWMDASDTIPYVGMFFSFAAKVVGGIAILLLVLGALGVRVGVH